MPVVRALRRSVTMAVLGLARIVLPVFGVVPPEWLMKAGREQPPVMTGAGSPDASVTTAIYESLVEDGESATYDKAGEESPEHQPR